jgi:hypothetical protein
MPPKYARELLRVAQAVERYGLLLEADPVLPSVSTLVAGEPVRGSWWGHRRGQAIYAVAGALEHRSDVLVVRLLLGKLTFVHRRLWPAVLGVAAASEPWQTERLSPVARALLARVRRQGTVRTDHLEALGGGNAPALNRAARELEARLLVRGGNLHTETGAHAKYVETWGTWADRAGYRGKGLSAERAKIRLEAAVVALPAGSVEALPWHRS